MILKPKRKHFPTTPLYTFTYNYPFMCVTMKYGEGHMVTSANVVNFVNPALHAAFFQNKWSKGIPVGLVRSLCGKFWDNQAINLIINGSRHASAAESGDAV